MFGAFSGSGEVINLSIFLPEIFDEGIAGQGLKLPDDPDDPFVSPIELRADLEPGHFHNPDVFGSLVVVGEALLLQLGQGSTGRFLVNSRFVAEIQEGQVIEPEHVRVRVGDQVGRNDLGRQVAAQGPAGFSDPEFRGHDSVVPHPYALPYSTHARWAIHKASISSCVLVVGRNFCWPIRTISSFGAFPFPVAHFLIVAEWNEA